MIQQLPRAVILIASAFSALLATEFVPASKAFDMFDILISGKEIQVTEASAKCDIGSTKNVSAKRLVNCDSAEYIEFRYKDRTQDVIKFTIDPNQKEISNGVRAELRDMHVAANGDEVWYRFATLIPDDDALFPIESKHRLVIAQWHQRIRGKKGLRPPLSHRLWGERFVVTLWNQKRIDERGTEGDRKIIFEIPKIERGIWYDYVYKIKWSSGVDGVIDSWLRQQCTAFNRDCGKGTQWKQVIRYRGPTGYDDELVSGYYFKFGLYTVTALTKSFAAFHRSYGRGDSAAAIGETAAIFQ